eukprot:CAMPEP_0206146004 /NCGR_PEP_ID=MMETSP1473-20131121/29223_1 /ASSEMBLY_ACC=CAM_ASM_001109 /TAXON_ID=1461547 /ORGANISM="Stichococcus sp, Strain RCC1054" /LENGTH=49 /DNA_ID= /DNA_START= /DNA_END= /DNA_ORIENTATION=
MAAGGSQGQEGEASPSTAMRVPVTRASKLRPLTSKCTADTWSLPVWRGR